MYNKLLLLRSFLFGLLLVILAAAPGVAQIQFATDIISQNSVTVPELAVDGSVTTAALLSAEPLIGVSALRIGFPAIAPKNMQAGILLQPDAELKLSLLNNVTIRTYKRTSTGTADMETFSLSQLVTLDMQSTKPTMVYFTPQRDFNQIELRISGAANLSGMQMNLFAAYAGVNTLPVVLTAFQGKATASGATLTWETASEHNADRFVVERAESASTDFRALGQVKSAGTSIQAHHYQFVDATPGGLRYYRLRQIDLDGKESFSPVVALQTEPQTASLAAYPSPATDILTLAGPAGTLVSMFDQLGHQVQTTKISLAQVQELDVRNLPNGVYYVQNTATGERTKFIKANGQR